MVSGHNDSQNQSDLGDATLHSSRSWCYHLLPPEWREVPIVGSARRYDQCGNDELLNPIAINYRERNVCCCDIDVVMQKRVPSLLDQSSVK